MGNYFYASESYTKRNKPTVSKANVINQQIVGKNGFFIDSSQLSRPDNKYIMPLDNENFRGLRAHREKLKIPKYEKK